MIEEKRGCGYRKVGALYLIGEGIMMPCDRLPFNLPEVCPCCGQGIKFTMGFTWINGDQLLVGNHRTMRELGYGLCPEDLCPVCRPQLLSNPTGLMWVGARFYTPDSFISEAQRMGVSKRIPFIPKELKLGETWVLLAHKKAGRREVEKETKIGTKVKELKPWPAIFYAFKPKRVEMLIWKSEATAERIAELEKRGITPIIVPDGDKDHTGSVYDDLKKNPKQQPLP